MQKEISHIWMKHHNQLLFFISKRVDDPQIAEDILQDVFIKILSKINSLEDSTKLQSWLYQIARNTIADYYRLKKKEDKFASMMGMDEENNDKSAMQEAESWIGLYVHALPENYRDALILSELKGLSIAQVAEKLNISYTNARAMITRGRQQLKKDLTDCCSFHVDVYGNIIDYHKKSQECKDC